MGQKSNPNSFNRKKQTAITFGGGVTSKTDYAALLKEYVALSSSITFLFEKNRCFVKHCFVTRNNEQSLTTIFVSFLV